MLVIKPVHSAKRRLFKRSTEPGINRDTKKVGRVTVSVLTVPEKELYSDRVKSILIASRGKVLVPGFLKEDDFFLPFLFNDASYRKKLCFEALLKELSSGRMRSEQLLIKDTAYSCIGMWEKALLFVKSLYIIAPVTVETEKWERRMLCFYGIRPRVLGENSVNRACSLYADLDSLEASDEFFWSENGIIHRLTPEMPEIDTECEELCGALGDGFEAALIFAALSEEQRRSFSKV